MIILALYFTIGVITWIGLLTKGDGYYSMCDVFAELDSLFWYISKIGYYTLIATLVITVSVGFIATWPFVLIEMVYLKIAYKKYEEED